MSAELVCILIAVVVVQWGNVVNSIELLQHMHQGMHDCCIGLLSLLWIDGRSLDSLRNDFKTGNEIMNQCFWRAHWILQIVCHVLNDFK